MCVPDQSFMRDKTKVAITKKPDTDVETSQIQGT